MYVFIFPLVFLASFLHSPSGTLANARLRSFPTAARYVGHFSDLSILNFRVATEGSEVIVTDLVPCNLM